MQGVGPTRTANEVADHDDCLARSITAVAGPPAESGGSGGGLEDFGDGQGGGAVGAGECTGPPGLGSDKASRACVVC